MPLAEEYAVTFFNSSKQLHNAKSDFFFKFAYKLSNHNKALYPSAFERQNVHLASTAESLSILREKLKIPHYGKTNAIYKIILTWWQIVNVKKM